MGNPKYTYSIANPKNMSSRNLITKYTVKIIAAVFIAYHALLFRPALAAQLDVVSSIQAIGVGQQFLVDVVLDTHGESINALQGKVVFPPGVLEIREIRDGDSLVNFWIEKPQEHNGAIVFSGITPGGYQGSKGLIFSAVFEAKARGSGSISIREAKVLRNDGEGTSATLTISPMRFSVSSKILAVPSSVGEIKDTQPPEEFKPEIAQDPALFEGRWFLVFATQDKGSGIDHYAVCEGNAQSCVTAESPYAVEHQELDQKIFVKAVDRKGNERVVMLPPKKPKSWYGNYSVWVILVLGVLIGYALWRKKRYKSLFKI